jgi:Ca-activated chloride channel homolog
VTEVFGLIFRIGLLGSAAIAGFFCCAEASSQNVSASSAHAEPAQLQMNVDEVVVTFNAKDANGFSVKDLKASEVRIRDNGAAPRRLVAFDELANRPIRVGILLDESESAHESLPVSRAIARKFVERLFRQRTDAAQILSFGYGSDVLRSWTGDPIELLQGIQSERNQQSAQKGTALFSAVFRACSLPLEGIDPTVTGNFIMLFSDGEDNAGLTRLEEAARACERTNTAVFAFLSTASPDRDSSGPKALRELAEKTGGRLFHADDSDDSIWTDLQEIESEMRNQYRLVYNPAELKHDGAFHEIELQPPDRVSRVAVRSGYFAPGH